MTRDELKRIIIEEVLRALAETGAAAAARSLSAKPVGGGAGAGNGVLLLTGYEPPSPALGEIIAGLAQHAASIGYLPSRSFRAANAGAGVDYLKNLKAIDLPKCERGLSEIVRGAAWILAPDVSPNTLNKTAMGIEDSLPSAAIGMALRWGKPCVLLECASVPTTVALERLELIRRLERRGARRASPDSVLRILHETLNPPAAQEFAPPPVKPIPKRAIITGEDVYEAARRGQKELLVPADAIVTSQAHEDAARRGLTIRREDS